MSAASIISPILSQNSFYRSLTFQKKKPKDAEDAEDKGERQILELRSEIEEDIAAVGGGLDVMGGEGNSELDDNMEGFVDELDELDEDEVKELSGDFKPMRLVLAKVSSGKLTCCTNSNTHPGFESSPTVS